MSAAGAHRLLLGWPVAEENSARGECAQHPDDMSVESLLPVSMAASDSEDSDGEFEEKQLPALMDARTRVDRESKQQVEQQQPQQQTGGDVATVTESTTTVKATMGASEGNDDGEEAHH